MADTAPYSPAPSTNLPDAESDAPFTRLVSSTKLSPYGRFSVGLETHTIAQLGYGMDPRNVPTEALRLMMTHPVIYLAARTVTSIIRRSDLYSIHHPSKDAALIAETEAWLWPLLPVVCAAAARAFCYGTVAVIFDWERKTLRFTVPAQEDKKARRKTAVDHTHFARACDVHPDETLIVVDKLGDIAGVEAHSSVYNAERTQVWVWDGEFGGVQGQAACRRSWKDYCECLILTILRDKYFERSVDPPRIAFAPDGDFVDDAGTKWRIPAYVVKLLDDLRGSGAIGLPSVTDAKGERKYAVDTLKLEDRSAVWDAGLNRHEANMFLSFLVAPQLQGLDDAAAGAGKNLEGMLKENIEDLARWVADGLTRMIAIVHKANHDPAVDEPCYAVATDVGKAAARKIYQEVLRLVNASTRGEIAMRTDVPKLLDKLGIDLRDPPDDWTLGEDASAPLDGRPEDPSGDRADRRDKARTPDGEADTGNPDAVTEDVPEEQPA